MKSLRLIIFLTFSIIILMAGCFNLSKRTDFKSVNGSMAMLSVNVTPGGFAHSFRPAASDFFAGSSEPWIDAENAGPAGYLKLNLQRVAFYNDRGEEFLGLDGAKQEVLFQGSGVVSNIPVKMPVGQIKSVKLFFEPLGKIKGALLNKTYRNINEPGQNIQFVASVRTLEKYYFDIPRQKIMDTTTNQPVAPAPGYSAYATSDGTDAEEATLCLSGQNLFVVETPLSITVNEGDSPAFTIMADLSRMLRFTISGGDFRVDGTPYYDTFTINHLINCQFAAFVGGNGRVQGYSYTLDKDNFSLHYGWLTLVFSPQGGFIYGAAIPDAHGSAPEGPVTAFTPAAGNTYTMIINKDASSDYKITNFQVLQSIGASVDCSCTYTAPTGGYLSQPVTFKLEMDYSQ
ncbi:MAG: hypothetical protein K6U80_09570 [Firmicutes bacterium]|nr:hypothetical protein [Bacillota bacterium]